MDIFLFWIGVAICVSVIARSKKRSGIGWFFYALPLWPIALPHILLSSGKADREQSRPARARSSVQTLTPTLKGDGSFDFDIVGEASYQEALCRIAGPRNPEGHEHFCEAKLMPENDNAHDRNAVAVYIGESKVGYLSRDKAASYRIGARDKKGHLLTKAECEAVVVGGWDRGDGDAGHYGVRLDILWPPQFAYR